MKRSFFLRSSCWISFTTWLGRQTAWLACVVVLCAGGILAQPSFVLAEESSYRQYPDRLMFRGGFAGIFGASTSLTFPGIGALGTQLDLQQNLGVDERDAFRLEGMWRFNRRHSVGFSWYRVGQAGQSTISEDITIDDKVIGANAFTKTSLNINLFRATYNWSFYDSDRMELMFSPGVYISDIDLDFAASGNITVGGSPVAGGTTQSQDSLTLPLPSVGFRFNYYITPKLLGDVRSDFFYLETGEFLGSMFEFYAGIEYRLFKHLGVGIAYDRLAVDVTDDKSDGLRVNLSFNMIYAYGTLYAFDTPL